ncbi:MAG: RidA family protein [Chloroflexi bacterium]|nr:RidA family protein [Chloroflexota bacterium]
MSERQRISTGTPWESIAGYARAVRAGNLIWVSGTTASDESGRVVAPGDPGAQARTILDKIERTLAAAGARLPDVVRTRIYVTDYAHWEPVARAHGERFAQYHPANTLVVVRSLVPSEALVEIEADALIGEP